MSALLSVKHWNLSNLCGLGDKIDDILTNCYDTHDCVKGVAICFPSYLCDRIATRLSSHTCLLNWANIWLLQTLNILNWCTLNSLSFLIFFFSLVTNVTQLEIGNRNKNFTIIVFKWAVISPLRWIFSSSETYTNNPQLLLPGRVTQLPCPVP